MKTLTRALMAVGLGLVGSVGTAQAALPYGYSSNSYGIAAGGCYESTNSRRHDVGDGGTYWSSNYGRSTSGYAAPSRFVHDRDRYSTLPSPHRGSSYGGWRDDRYDAPGRFSSKPISHRDRYEDHYDGSPLFEPWRPNNASHDRDRRKW